jgi:hypothetical protein
MSMTLAKKYGDSAYAARSRPNSTSAVETPVVLPHPVQEAKFAPLPHRHLWDIPRRLDHTVSL